MEADAYALDEVHIFPLTSSEHQSGSSLTYLLLDNLVTSFSCNALLSLIKSTVAQNKQGRQGKPPADPYQANNERTLAIYVQEHGEVK